MVVNLKAEPHVEAFLEELVKEYTLTVEAVVIADKEINLSVKLEKEDDHAGR